MNTKVILILAFLIIATMITFLEAAKKKHTKYVKNVKMHHDYLRTSTACTTACTSHSGYVNCGLISESCCPSANCTGAWYSGYDCANGTTLNITC